MRFINIGFGNVVSAQKVVSVVSPDSAPIKRIIQTAKADCSLIDATFGRKCKAVIITDSDHIILSAITPETISSRLEEELKNG
ncbi:MAG: DUF370 domain-containing protein [Ruminococcus sp.]|nr:DUF370 domain-containing protein [Ruminococcus sp.]